MRKKLFTFLLALVTSVGMSWATVITWNASKVSSMAMNVSSGSDSRTSDGITVTAVSTGEFVVFGDHGGAIEIGNGEGSGGGYLTFTSSVGNIAQIDINHSGAGEWRNANGDWISPYYVNFDGGMFRWSGTPAASITLTGDAPRYIYDITSIEFTIEDGGGSAQAGLQVTELQVLDSWEDNRTMLSTSDMPGFVAITKAEAQAWDAAPAGKVVLIFAFEEDAATSLYFKDGVYQATQAYNITYEDLYAWHSEGEQIFYTGGGSTPATGLQVIELQVPDTWENDQQLVIVPDLPGFVVFTLEEAGTWAAPEGYAHLIYTSKNNEGVRVTYFNNGVWGQEYIAGITRATVYGWASSGHRIFYTTDGSEPTPDPTTSGSCGANVTWEFDPSTGALTITGTGAMDDYLNNASTPWNSYITDITSVTITDGVTNVGNRSFEQCKSLTTVTIGDDVETIGTFAFSECGEQFTTLTLGNSIRTIGNQAFASNNGITGFTLPSTLETIGNFAFIHNSAITTLTIPSNVTSIDADAFYGCTAVTDVYCYPNAADLTWNEDGCDDFKTGKATICHVNADQLDAYQTKFNGVVRVTFVGDLDALAPTPAPAGLQVTELQVLDSWQNDNTLVTISDLSGFVAVSLEKAGAWDAAPADDDVILIYAGTNEGVTAIEFNNRVLNDFGPFGGFTRADIFGWGYKIFYTSGGSTPAVDPAVQNVIALINAIPDPVAYNDECKNAIDAARSAYDELTDAQKALVENYGALLDAETAYALLTPHPSGECGAQGNNLLWELDPSTGVLTITGSGAMYDWAYDTDLPWYDNRLQITSVVLPSGITSLGTKAFRGCQNLASINMTENYPAGLTAINQEAFCHTALTSVTIPESVVTIGQDAFYQSQSITDVYCYADPNNLTWTDFWGDDFNQSPSKSTQCHVKDCHLDVFNTNWNTGNTTDVNVTFVGDLPGDCGAPTPTNPVIKLNANFGGPDNWADTEAFTDNGDGTATLSNIALEFGYYYNFSVNVGDEWFSINHEFTRQNPSCVISNGEGIYYFQADVTGEYTFTWEYATNTLTIGYPHTYTAVGHNLAIFDNSWDPSITDNDLVLQEDGSYKWEKENVSFTGATTIQYRVCKDHAWDVAYPATSEDAATFEIPSLGDYKITITYNPVGNVVSASAEKIDKPTIQLNGNFSGEWTDTEAFEVVEQPMDSYAKLTKLLEPGTYEFGVKVNGEWRANGSAYTRDNYSYIIEEGHTGNLTINVDVKGYYSFFWYYDNNRLIIDYSRVCGMYWKDVTAGNFEVTLGQEGEVTLPKVWATSMAFVSNIASGSDQVRLGSTDETVATIAYTLSEDGLGTLTFHQAGECDIYVVHDITNLYCYDSCAFHLTVHSAPTTAVVIGDPNDASQVETFLTTYDGQTIDELIIDRPVLNNMYNTLCLPFDMNATQIAASSLNGVIIREFTGASVVGQTLELAVSDPVNAVVAGRPYFVQYSAASQLDDLHFEDVTINNALLDNMAVTFDGVTFKGTFTPFVMPNGLNFQGGYLFLGQNNQLFWPNTPNPLKPFRAYFYVNVESSTPGNAPKYRGMPARIVEGKNVATGVENAQSANQSTKVIVNGQLIIIKNDVRYNAQGQIVK